MTHVLCPSCGEEAIKPYGYSRSKILVVGEFPGEDEMKSGIPFSGNTGKIFRRELTRVGLDMFRCRLTNLWLHKPNKNANCLKAGVNVVLNEAKNKEAILLVGSECVEYFTGYKVSEVSGLQVDVECFSASIIFAMVQPAIAFHKPFGEVRMAIEKFYNLLKEKEIV